MHYFVLLRQQHAASRALKLSIARRSDLTNTAISIYCSDCSSVTFQTLESSSGSTIWHTLHHHRLRCCFHSFICLLQLLIPTVHTKLFWSLNVFSLASGLVFASALVILLRRSLKIASERAPYFVTSIPAAPCTVCCVKVKSSRLDSSS